MNFESVEGFEICCKTCRKDFWICRRCYRGHRYCSGICRADGRKIGQKISKLKYDQSVEAREDHRERQQAYRDRKRESLSNSTSSVTEQPIASFKVSVEAQIEIWPDRRRNNCVCCKENRFLHPRGANVEEEKNSS